MRPLHQRLLYSAIIVVLSLQFLGGCVEALKNFVYERNGVRLYGGDKTRGRVEVLPRQPWATKDWVQVCDDSLTDSMAQDLCKLLEYRFGRKYYTAEIAFPGSNVTSIKASGITCFTSSSGYRRQLHGEGLISADDDAVTHQDVDPDLYHQGRKLLSPLWGYIDAPDLLPYTCQFRIGTCNPKGPVAGLQCSNKTLAPAPPPPPSPPTSPPPPPSIANSIRIFTSYTSWSDGPLEPNLCNNPNTSSVCTSYGRVEIEVPYDKKNTTEVIWAPACNITDPLLAYNVAKLACEQRFQEKKLPWLPNAWYISARVSSTPFYIPSATQVVNKGDFNSKAVKRYLTITGGRFPQATKLQELRFKLSGKRCASNSMLAFGCSLASNDGAIP